MLTLSIRAWLKVTVTITEEATAISGHQVHNDVKNHVCSRKAIVHALDIKILSVL